MTKQPLYFIHVPKTAGTALRGSLNSMFSGLKIVDSWNNSDLFRLNMEDCKTADLVMAHCGLAFSPYLKNVDYCIVLRDPIELTLSYYEQLLKDPYNLLHSYAISMSCDEFFNEFNFLEKYANPYTRAFMTSSPELLHYQFYGYEKIDYQLRAIEIKYWLRKNQVPYIRHIIDADDLDAGLADIAISRGFLPIAARKINVNSGKNYINKYSTFFERIRFLNEADYQLIAELKKQREFDLELGVLKYRSCNLLNRGSLIYPSAEYFYNGWHDVEFYDGKSAVWSNSKSAEIILPVSEAVRKVIVRFSMPISLVSDIDIEVNHLRVEALIAMNYEENAHDYIMAIDLRGIPRSAIGYRITLNNLPLISPSEMSNDFNETRSLGIYVFSITLL